MISAGELLASFELLPKDAAEELPILPPTRGDLYMVPFGVRPLLQKTRVEVCKGCSGIEGFQGDFQESYYYSFIYLCLYIFYAHGSVAR